MRDHDDRPPVRKVGKRLLHAHLVVGVGEGRRLVEHDDRRVLQKRAGDGDALALAAGKIDAVRPQARADAVGKFFDDVHALRLSERGENLLVRRVRARKAHVVGDGSL